MTARLLQAFSLALLALQLLLPWLYPDFHFQDGPAHIYTARALKAVLADSGSPFHGIYEVNRVPVPNWTNTLIFTLADSLVGHRRAEALAYSLYLMAAYCSFAYALRSLTPNSALLLPVLNAVVWPKYLFFGFFNFYLGVAGMVFTLAFSIRHWAEAGWRLYLRLGVLLLLLYFTHLVPAFLAAGAILLAGIWVRLALTASPRPAARALRHMLFLAVLILPLLALTSLFVANANKGISPFTPSLSGTLSHLERFPFEAFTLAHRPHLDQKLLLAVLLILIALGFFSLFRRRDTSPAALLLCLSALLTLLSFIVPDAAFGGSWFKQRLGWVAVVFGVIGATALGRPRAIVSLLNFAAGALMTVTVLSMVQQAGRIGAAYAEFSRIEDRITPGSTLMRITLPAPRFGERHAMQDLGFLPFQHAELLIAARCRCFALTDLQALLGLYPLAMKIPYPPAIRERLLLLADDPPLRPAPHLEILFRDLPELPGYVLVFGESQWSLREVEQVLSAGYEHVPAEETATFLRLYKRRAPATRPD